MTVHGPSGRLLQEPAAPESAPRVTRRSYGRWREEALIPRLFETVADPDRFQSRLEHRGLGSVAVLAYAMGASRYTRTAERARRDGVDHVWLQLIGTGGLVGSSRGRETTLTPGFAGLCDLSAPTDQQSLASSGRALLIPRSAFGQADVRALHGASASGAPYRLLDDYLEWLSAAPAPSAHGDEGRIARAIAEVVVACLTTGARPGERAAGELGPLVLRRARAFIGAHLAQPDLEAAAIAKAAGVSRATLYRLCADKGGVAELVWSIRLEAARAALSDPAKPGHIAVIAEQHGFASAQHFSRRFRERYGFSPRNLRPL